MYNEYQSVEGLIDGIKGTTGFVSNFLSPKFGIVFLILALGLIVTKFLF